MSIFAGYDFSRVRGDARRLYRCFAKSRFTAAAPASLRRLPFALIDAAASGASGREARASDATYWLIADGRRDCSRADFGADELDICQPKCIALSADAPSLYRLPFRTLIRHAGYDTPLAEISCPL